MTNFIKSKTVKAALGLLVVAAMVFAGNTAKAATISSSYLKQGMTNADVMTLQTVLNMAADTQVAATGAGSAGQETMYFGSRTKAAVVKFQQKYASEILTPLGLTAGTGYAGSATLAKVNAILAGNTNNNNNNNNNNQGSGPVTVSLASDTPAAGYLVASQATADLAHFTFMGNGTVSSVQLQRTGISNNSVFDNVYLYDGNARLSDAASINSTGVVTFNALGLMVNGSKTISVKADVNSSASGQTAGVTLTGYSVSGAAMTTANVAGNIMSIASSSGVLGTLTVGTNTVTGSPTVDAGATQYTLWSAPITIGTHSMWLKSLAFRYIGSAPNDALTNVKLYVDGSAVATASAINNLSYLTFDFMGNPLSVSTGAHTFDVRADIVKGSARTVSLSLQNKADLMMTDSQANVNVATSSTLPNTGATITINAGSVSVNIDPTFNSMTNVTGGGTNSVIARYKLHGYGEDVKVQSLQVTPTFSSPTLASGSCTQGTDCTMNNVALYFNGAQIGSSQTLNQASATTLTFTLGSSLIVPAGVDSFLEVRADLQNTSNVNYTGGSLTVTLEGSSSMNNGQGLNSLTSTIDVPGADVTTTGLTIQTGSLAISTNPAFTSQTMNPNTAGAKVGSFILQNQSTSESVRVTNLAVGLTLSTISTTNLANLKTSETSGNGATPVSPQTTNNFSVNFTLAPGATKTIDISTDLGTATAGSIVSTMQLTAIGVSSNVTVCSSSLTGGSNGCGSGTALNGQTITLGSGTFGTPTFVTSGSTLAQNIAGGTTSGVADASKAQFKFTASNGNAVITELGFADTVAGGALTGVKVNGISAPVSSNKAYIFGLNIPVPQGGAGATIDAFASYAPVGTTGVSTTVTGDITSLFKLSYVKYTIGGTTSTLCASAQGPGGSSCTATTGMPVNSAQTMILVGSKPTVTVAQPSGVVLTGSSYVEAIDVTIAADAAGPITMVSFPITASLSAGAGSPTFSTGSGNPFIVKDANNNSISTVTGNFTATSGGTATVTLNSTTGYLIGAGQSQTFKVFLPVNALGTGTLPNTFMYTSLAASSAFAWIDTAGGATVTTTNVTGNIYNYPSTFTSSIHN